MPPITIGVIAEGITDQQVIERLLLPLATPDNSFVVNFLQPRDNKPGGWGMVFKYVAGSEFRGAFQSNNFVVIHIDTDTSDDFTPPIARSNAGVEVSSEDLIQQVKSRLIASINSISPDAAYYEQRKAQIIFAIAVHSIECWLLPLFCDHENPRHRRDNCLNLLNQNLQKLGFTIDSASKLKGYNKLLLEKKIKKPKREAVLDICQYNPGFADFAAQVEDLINQTQSTPPEEAVAGNIS